MNKISQEIALNRFSVMRQRRVMTMTPAQIKWLADQQIKKEMDTRNNIACAVEHMWYLARSLERIEKHIGMTEEKKHPTANGLKDGPSREKSASNHKR